MPSLPSALPGDPRRAPVSHLLRATAVRGLAPALLKKLSDGRKRLASSSPSRPFPAAARGSRAAPASPRRPRGDTASPAPGAEGPAGLQGRPCPLGGGSGLPRGPHRLPGAVGAGGSAGVATRRVCPEGRGTNEEKKKKKGREKKMGGTGGREMETETKDQKKGRKIF